MRDRSSRSRGKAGQITARGATQPATSQTCTGQATAIQHDKTQSKHVQKQFKSTQATHLVSAQAEEAVEQVDRQVERLATIDNNNRE